MKKLSSIIQRVKKSNIIIPFSVFINLIVTIISVVGFIKARKCNKKKTQIIIAISVGASSLSLLHSLSNAFKPEEEEEEINPLDEISSLEEDDLDD